MSKWEYHGTTYTLTIQNDKVVVNDGINSLSYDRGYFGESFLFDSKGEWDQNIFESLPESIRRWGDPANTLESYDGTKHKFAVSPKMTKKSKRHSVSPTKKPLPRHTKKSKVKKTSRRRKTYKGKKSIRYSI